MPAQDFKFGDVRADKMRFMRYLAQAIQILFFHECVTAARSYDGIQDYAITGVSNQSCSGAFHLFSVCQGTDFDKADIGAWVDLLQSREKGIAGCVVNSFQTGRVLNGESTCAAKQTEAKQSGDADILIDPGATATVDGADSCHYVRHDYLLCRF